MVFVLLGLVLAFPANYDFVIRACQNRPLVTDNGAREPEAEALTEEDVVAQNIDEALHNATFQFHTEASVSGRVSKISGETRPRRKSREARNCLRPLSMTSTSSD